MDNKSKSDVSGISFINALKKTISEKGFKAENIDIEIDSIEIIIDPIYNLLSHGLAIIAIEDNLSDIENEDVDKYLDIRKCELEIMDKYADICFETKGVECTDLIKTIFDNLNENEGEEKQLTIMLTSLDLKDIGEDDEENGDDDDDLEN